MGFDAGVTRRDVPLHQRMVEGARLDLKSAQFAYDRSLKRLTEAREDLNRTSTNLTRTKERLARLEAGDTNYGTEVEGPKLVEG